MTRRTAGRRKKAKPAKRRAAKPAAKRATGKKRTAKKRAAKRPRLALVPRPARRAAKPAPRAFPQTVGASGKQMVLFRLLRARARVHAAIQGMLAGVAEQPLGKGKWNTRETLLHLVIRDRARLREFEAALRGVPVSWQAIDRDARAMARLNAADLASLAHLAWDDAIRLLHSTRQELMDALEGVPEEPAEVWHPDHSFGWMLDALPKHDEHHAEIIKRWRAEAGA